jgi:hypothetical protein
MMPSTVVSANHVLQPVYRLKADVYSAITKAPTLQVVLKLLTCMILTMAPEFTKTGSVVRRHQQYVSGVIKPETRMLPEVMMRTV